MIGFHLVNLIIPNAPAILKIKTKNGEWQLERENGYLDFIPNLMRRNACAETYVVINDKKSDKVFDELLYICLASSFLTGSAVTVKRLSFLSDISIVALGDRFPRERGISGFEPIVKTGDEFAQSISIMVDEFPTIINTHNAEVIIHHWLDSLSCWLLEDLYLSSCTVLEIIKQNERRRSGNDTLSFYSAISSASIHYGISILSKDWINMRNDLIHDGKLSSSKFSDKNKKDCMSVCTDVLNWIDEYILAVFGVGPIKNKRFSNDTLELNSYTIY